MWVQLADKQVLVMDHNQEVQNHVKRKRTLERRIKNTNVINQVCHVLIFGFVIVKNLLL